MKTLSIAALIVLSSMAGLTHAQATPQRSAEERRLAREQQEQRTLERRRVQQQSEQRLLERRREERTACPLPDGTSQPLNTVVNYEGQTYRCVEVFTPNAPGPLENQTLTVRIAGWIKVQVP